MHQDSQTTGLEIAVVGMAGRFPGARSAEELWRNVRDGVESVSFFSDEELLAAGVDPAAVRAAGYVKAGAVLADIDRFDAEFFGFNPREAELLDPQHRVFLECAWEALESAGYDARTCKGIIGVYAGSGRNSYLYANVYANPDLVAAAGVFQTVINNDKDSLALRTAYHLGLRGPAITVQSACSTSLVAVHLAAQSLLSGDCDLCLAGGISISLPQTTGYVYREGMVLSPDGHCRAFDAHARGAVPGRGVGIVVLKRLADAIDDRDTILGVIKGSAINNDGADKIGYTAPAVDGQAAVIRAAHLRAGVRADSISYVEAHGTGTDLGDPIEIAALNLAFRVERRGAGSCAIGSIKTNIGHLDAAAGVTGLIKTVMALRHRQIPPSLHYVSPNPEIDFAAGPFYVPTRLEEWRSDAGPRRAGVSSFGMGGTNAHVVLEEAPALRTASRERQHRLLLLSARSGDALNRATESLAAHLLDPGVDLDDAAYTLQTGRRTFNHRRMIVSAGAADAGAALRAKDARRVIDGVSDLHDRTVAFMFPGQGAQYVDMARGLFEERDEFRATVVECCRLITPHMGGIDLLRILYPAASDRQKAGERLTETAVAQPALFIVEYALARMLMAWGLTPAATIGHSVGEFVAACIAEVFTLERALALVAARGRLMQALPPGSMMAVAAPHTTVEELAAQDGLSLAAVNGPALSVVAGAHEAIDRFERRLLERELTGVRLHTSHAFHSSMMDAIVEPFAELVARAMPAAPRVPYISNVTGTWIVKRDATDPHYWARHLRQPVLFGAGIREMLADPRRALLEVGPGGTLVTLAKQNAKRDAVCAAPTLRRPQETAADAAVLLGTLGQLWLAGVPIDFERFHAGDSRRRVPLPTYPFARERFWVEPRGRQAGSDVERTVASRRSRPEEWCYAPVWKTSVSSGDANTIAPATWLAFVSDRGTGARVAAELARHSTCVVQVIPGERFERIHADRFIINPERRDDYDRLLADLRADRRAIDRVAHLWDLSAPGARAAGVLDGTFYSTLFTIQALGADRSQHVSHFSVVTGGAQAVMGTERIGAASAAVLGLCRVVPQEYPGLTCAAIDVDLAPTGGEASDAVVAAVVRELIGRAADQSADQVVALRGSRRWVQTFELVSGVAPVARLRTDGVYLITGGWGRVGLALARHLARTRVGGLVLAGRSVMPARDDWDRFVAAHDDADPIAQRIRAVQAIEELGVPVAIECVDAADPDAMRALIDRIDERFGRLDGVVHAAGVVSGDSFRPIQHLDRAACDAQFAPKVRGVEALALALGARPLDFCLLTSSVSTLFGGIGFGAYAAANQYLDAVAHRQHHKGRPWWISVNWEGWDFAPASGAPRGAAAAFALTEDDGTRAFDRLLACVGAPQIVVSTADVAARMARSVVRDTARESEARAVSTYARPALQNPYVPPQTEMEKTIAAIWRERLGVDAVGIHDNFFDLGGHSLLAIEVVASLKTLAGNISIATIFEYPTVHALARSIDGGEMPAPTLTVASGRAERRRQALKRLEAVE